MPTLTHASTPRAASSSVSGRLLRIGYWVCVFIAVAVVLRRIYALAHPAHGSGNPLAALDGAFAAHTALTLAHILPALAFVLLTPFVLLRKRAHAGWPEHLLFPLGAVVGITAYAMSRYAYGGWIERAAVFLFNSLFLFSLARAFVYLRRGEMVEQRRWTLRAIVILLGIATTRPVMGLFFATSRLTHLTPDQFFGIAFWIGFSINALVVELWLRRRKRPAPTVPVSAAA